MGKGEKAGIRKKNKTFQIINWTEEVQINSMQMTLLMFLEDIW